MQTYTHPTGLVEYVPTRADGEKKLLEQHGLDAILAVLANQRALAVAIGELRPERAAMMAHIASEHPIEAGARALNDTLAALEARMKELMPCSTPSP